MDLCRIVGAVALSCALTGLASAQSTDRAPGAGSVPRLAATPPLGVERPSAAITPSGPAPRTADPRGIQADDFRGDGRPRRFARDGAPFGDDPSRRRARDEGSSDAARPPAYGWAPDRDPGRYAAPAPSLHDRPGPPIRHAAADARIQPTGVSFAGADGEVLQGQLFRPPGVGPFPAVVALHGCAGLYSRSGDLNPRHTDWGERLAAQGFLVLMPDSFGSRDLGPQCGTAGREIRPGRERVADAVAAKAYLQGRRDVRADAVSLLGWSNGGSTVLYAARAGLRDTAGGPPFARAVAFYPGCRVPAERGWQAGLPLLILIGEADDWTPADTCRAMVEAARRRGEPVDIKVYPGAYHDFDHPDLPVRERRNLAYTAGGEGIAHVGTDPAARADALRRVPAFLGGEPAARPGAAQR